MERPRRPRRRGRSARHYPVTARTWARPGGDEPAAWAGPRRGLYGPGGAGRAGVPPASVPGRKPCAAGKQQRM